MPQSLIGIFYLINGRMVFETAPVATIKTSGGVRAYPRQHYELWSELQKKDPDLYDLDPMPCHEAESTITKIRRNSGLLPTAISWKKDRLRTLVIQDFHLEKSDVQFNEDERYRCAVCENGLEQR